MLTLDDLPRRTLSTFSRPRNAAMCGAAACSRAQLLETPLRHHGEIKPSVEARSTMTCDSQRGGAAGLRDSWRLESPPSPSRPPPSDDGAVGSGKASSFLKLWRARKLAALMRCCRPPQSSPLGDELLTVIRKSRHGSHKCKARRDAYAIAPRRVSAAARGIGASPHSTRRKINACQAIDQKSLLKMKNYFRKALNQHPAWQNRPRSDTTFPHPAPRGAARLRAANL